MQSTIGVLITAVEPVLGGANRLAPSSASFASVAVHNSVVQSFRIGQTGL